MTLVGYPHRRRQRPDSRHRRAAARQRQYRQRRRQGLVVYRVKVDEHALAGALIDSGRLSADDVLRRVLIETELGEIVREWATRWSVMRNAFSGER